LISSITDFYVDDDGDNSNDGLTLQTPWKTITYAYSRIAECIPTPNGVKVHVASGTYNKTLGEIFPLTMINGVSLLGSGAESTILDAESGWWSDDESVISCYNIISGETIDGFTIRDGNWDKQGRSGGGIGIYGSSITIANCHINHNRSHTPGTDNFYGGIFCENSSVTVINSTISDSAGSGIYCVNSSLSITASTIRDNHTTGRGIRSENSFLNISNCMITGNENTGISCYFDTSITISDSTIFDNSGRYGGGFYFSNSSGVVDNCTISGNTATSGGGIYTSPSSLLITNCTISNNHATDTMKSSGGGGIYITYMPSPTFRNCTITGNSAIKDGGGILSYGYSFPSIKNCLITNNTAEQGAGIACVRFTSPKITNCTIVGNTATLSGGGIGCYYNGRNPLVIDSASPYIVNTILWSNSTEVYAGVSGNPKLSYCNIQGGYSGLGNIDADPLFVHAPNGDYRLDTGSPSIDSGHPRIYDSDSSRSDMGTYGGGGSSDPNPASITVAGDGSGDYTSIQDAIDFSITGDTITVFPGTYYENLVINGKEISIIRGSGAGPATLDGGGALSVVHLVNAGPNTLLQGFIIQNGLTFVGGGISCWYSSPTIASCIIKDNIGAATIGGRWGEGGGLYCYGSSPKFVNSTFTGNEANYLGGGIRSVDSSATIINSIFWEDTANGIPNEISILGGTVTSTYSDIQGGYTGAGNINQDPLFLDPVNGDYHLSADSPCIDIGDPSSAPPDFPENDIDGDLRPQGTYYDMGADEFTSCDMQGVTGEISPSDNILWPPNHDLIPITIDTSALTSNNPDLTIIPLSINSVSVTEYSSQEAGEAYGDNVYDPNNFEPDVEITGNFTLNLRSERTGASTGRTYTIKVTATDCSGSYDFLTEVIVPHDKQ
jgi:predicted outer membrane repeat protein